jgi:RNA polymerase sigma-54 factor
VVPDILITRQCRGGWDIALNEATLPADRQPRLLRRTAPGCDDKQSQRLAEGEAGRCQLADQGARPAAEDDPQGRRRDREAAGRLLPPRRFRTAPAHPARRWPNDRDARKHGQPRHQQQVPRLRARDVRTEVLLHQRRGAETADGERRDLLSDAPRSRRGIGIKALIDAETPKNILSDDKLAESCSAKEGFDLARPHRGQIPRGDRHRAAERRAARAEEAGGRDLAMRSSMAAGGRLRQEPGIPARKRRQGSDERRPGCAFRKHCDSKDSLQNR